MSDALTALANRVAKTSPNVRAAMIEAAAEVQVLQTDVAALKAAVAALAPAPASGWTVAAPGSTGKQVTVSPGQCQTICLNIQQGGVTFEDYDFPHGSGDSMVLVGSGGRFVHDVTLRRMRLRNVAAGNAVSWGKHGFYLDGYNLLLEDLDIQCAAPAGSCLSIRMGGTVIRRALLAGNNNSFIPIGIFDSDTGQSDGTVLVENFRGTFTADTGIWCDAQDDFKTTFDLRCTFRGGDLTGPGAFLKASRVRNGSFRFESCTLNGNPVRSVDVPAGSVIA